MKELFLIREFDREKDYPMVCGWWEGHESIPVPLNALPPCGIVIYKSDGASVEDMAALWLHLSLSCGVSFLEPAVSRPGIALKDAGAAFLRGIDYLKLAAQEMDYGLMLLRTVPAIARYAKKAGFIAHDKPLVNLSMLTHPSEEKILCQ